MEAMSTAADRIGWTLPFTAAEYATEVGVEELEAYFEACKASSSVSTLSSDAEEADGEPLPTTSTHLTTSIANPATPLVGRSSSLSHLSPLQGSVPRPLLLRQRQVSGSGTDASSPLHEYTALPATSMRPSLNRQVAPATATATTDVETAGLVAPAVRGPAGQEVADELQKASLPLAPTAALCHLTHGADATTTAGVFEFSLPTPTAAPSSSSPQSSTVKGRCRSTRTITTRGRGSRSPSSPLVEGRAQRHARQRAVLFDVLCALRQHSTASCEAVAEGANPSGAAACASPARRWRLRDSVMAEALAQHWPPCFIGAMEQLLEVATEVAGVVAQADLFEQVCTAHNGAAAAAAGAATGESADIQDATCALELAGQEALKRLSLVLRQLSADFLLWVLQVQEYLIVTCAAAFGGRRRTPSQQQTSLFHEDPCTQFCGHRGKDCGTERPAGAFGSRDGDAHGEEEGGTSRVTQENILAPCHSLLDVVLTVQENSIPLQRCRVLVDDSGCFDGLSDLLSGLQHGRQSAAEGAPHSSSDPPHPPASFAVLAARLLDTLIIQASAAQDTSTMDLYRFYVMLLLYTAWPYVLLCTAAVFGFVRDIDPPVWRRQLPRLFRSSFSHVRIGDAHRHYPTDVLSLLLNCVGYYNSSEVFHDACGAQQRQEGTTGSGGSAVDRSCVPQTHWKRVKGSRGSNGGERHKDMSEHYVALAALASARAFVLRSLASFTRRKKQVALSRTPARPSAASQPQEARPESKGSCSASGGGAGVHASPPPWQHWQKKSVKDILQYIMYGSGGREGAAHGGEHDDPAEERGDDAGAPLRGPVADAGAAVVAYAQENQDVRRRLVEVPPNTTAAGATTAAMQNLTPDGKHYLYYPTTIPLGFATMAKEALAGEQRWQQQLSRAVERTEAEVSAPTQMPSLPLPIMRQPLPNDLAHRRSSEGWRAEQREREGEGEADVGVGAGESELLQRRALSLWSLFIVESTTAPDVLFTNAKALTDDDFPGRCGALSGDDDGPNARSRRAYESASHSARRKRTHQLWINITIPCARWVTTALLIPIGVAVQRLQERRLHDLFSMSLQAVQHSGLHSMADNFVSGGAGSRGGNGSGLLWRNNEEEDQGGTGVSGGGCTTHPFMNPVASSSPVAPAEGGCVMTSCIRTPPSTAACSFLHSLKLLVDVALCRDQERLVFGFLERLYKEPRWWVRRWVDGGVGAFQQLGTAAPTVSALFADALRGKRLGELVRLVVLPARDDRSDPAPAAKGNPTPQQRQQTPEVSPSGGADAASASTISSSILDVFASFQLEFTLPAAFALVLQPRDLSVYVQPTTNSTERSYQTFFWPRRRRLYVEEAAAPSAAATTKTRVALSDVWSYVFGYQCSLYYAQITLREHKKQLHQRDTQDFKVAQAMGPPRVRVTDHLQYISRGLGSAYYTLNFAVDTLLSFTQAEAMRTVYDLEHLLHRAMRASPELHSCMELCHELDTLLLQLYFVSFPARPAMALNARERAMQSPAAEAVRSAVQRILEVALDPSRLPVSYISSTTRNSVEALVAAVTAAEEHQSVLASRLHPLRVRLTFNKYYGTPEETLSYRFR
ncbi:hypothetical protein ABL78_1229 [Leptomonas seymouri]|uniref:Uncharacterized protein n=1 Tax=Leptomonas seymouri TaxID=5684 RepID=A0A0N1PE37_LEPSE|nr:hypothetical protein ABL78_1229 [Leptomonas seymouri]|eukprot:KPI89648.1 hypothetical protein ABL78_1229 [Leptomonas seymouri]